MSPPTRVPSPPIALGASLAPDLGAPAPLRREPGPDPGLRSIAGEAGLTSVRLVAWRDLDDPEAGGSELHAHRIAAQWARSGLQVAVRTSAVPGGARRLERDGYGVLRRSGRYGVFPQVAWEGVRRARQPGEGLVEIWNGMPFWSPVWFRGPRVVLLHHVHAEMWRMVLPAWMARLGWATERRLAPPVYRRTRVLTLSESSRAEIVDLLGLRAERVSVVAPGVDPDFAPGGRRSDHPLVVAVGRLVPVKRFDVLIRALALTRHSVPGLRAEIVGDGYERADLERLVDGLGAADWLSLPGHLGSAELVERYRRAWVVASASQREGWGMSLTEAGACATPAVASDIAGHRDAVVDGESGILAGRPGRPGAESALAQALTTVLTDRSLRERLGAGALARARGLSWEAAARETLEALAEEACWASGRRSHTGR